jgi:prepilin-type N-terminal cleavage/methylation domain-containing protein
VAGFTLLELLIAITVSAALLTAAVQAYTQLTRAMEKRLDDGGRDRIATLVLDRLERELVGTLLVAKPKDSPRETHPWVFLGADGTYEEREADSLKFITESPGRATEGAETPGYALVTYLTRPNDEGKLDLYRTEIPVPLTLPEITRDDSAESIELAPAVRNIARFGLEFIDEKSGESAAAWDSTTGLAADTLPSAVKLTVQLYAASKGARKLVPGTVLTRRVTLPVRPLGESDDGGECEDGLAVDACIDRILEQFPDLASDERELLDELAVSVEDRCFAGRGSPQLAALRAALIELIGTDPTEICSQ